MNRYHRQMLLPAIGERGQCRLAASRALIVGCGALGTVIADSLARAGVGALSIVDRDVVEITNLQRQVLFDECDADTGVPKAVAAREKLARINSSVQVDAFVEDFNHTNAERIARGCDIILDGLDNFLGRYLLNDLAVFHGLPYLYGGAVGTTGMACVFLPHPGGTGTVQWQSNKATPCLRCVFPEPPPPGSTPTCDTAGVLASAVAMIAHHQVVQAIKLLTGNLDAVDRSLLSIDVWHNEFRRLDISTAHCEDGCYCCGERAFSFLYGEEGTSATTLCGRGAVQINPRRTIGDSTHPSVDLGLLASRLQQHGEFHTNVYLMRGTLRGETGETGELIELTVFADGRTIVSGTARADIARTVYDKYVGG